MSGDELTCDVTVMAGGAIVGKTTYTLSTDEVVARQAKNVNITTTLPADPSNLIVVSGKVRNPDMTDAAGVDVELSLGDYEPYNFKTGDTGTYSRTFFDAGASMVAVGDTLNIQVRASGAAINKSMAIRSYHVISQRVNNF